MKISRFAGFCDRSGDQNKEDMGQDQNMAQTTPEKGQRGSSSSTGDRTSNQRDILSELDQNLKTETHMADRVGPG